MVFVIILAIIGLFGLIVWSFTSFAPQFGTNASGERLQRMQNSPNFKDGIFLNPQETSMGAPNSSSFKTILEFIKKREGRNPDSKIPFRKIEGKDIGTLGDKELKVTWLGHSTLLIEIGGKVFLTDPVFGKTASPMSFFGPKSFHDEMPVPIDSLPELDAVILSHDHYDHLDYKSISKLKSKTRKFYAPLGVGAHLNRWGIKDEDIIEKDWWEKDTSIEGIEFIATPARHFSGRGFTDRYANLWCSWVIRTENLNIFFGGDSGYGKHFTEIGEKYGPFNLTMLECGAYNEDWPFIHSMPEQTAQSQKDLRGEVLLPIHWAKFNLALHPWKEPIERLLKKANELNMTVTTPLIGEPVLYGTDLPTSHWWGKEE